MSLFKWSNEYSVGAPVMDDHHKQLFGIMNKLYEVRDAGNAKTGIIPLLDELIKYTEYHFGEEERLMERAGYSGLFSQRIAHQELVDKLKDYRNKAGNPTMAIFVANEASMAASDWLKHHIMKMDKAYEGTLKNVGIN